MSKLFEVQHVTRSGRGLFTIKGSFDLTIDDPYLEYLTFGEFLSNYGEKILNQFHLETELDAWEVEPESFPMKLSVNLEDECLVFNAASREFMITLITKHHDSVFLLENIPQSIEEKMQFKNNTYKSPKKPEENVIRENFILTKDGPEEIAEGHPGRYQGDLLDVRIEFEDQEKKTHVAIISFPKEEAEGISFGIFLRKYGKHILDLFRTNLGDQIPSYSSGPAFPMLLKFFDYKKSDAGFNSENRDQTLLWNSRNNILVLCSESDENKLSNAVSDVDDLIPNCVICHDPLHNKVHVACKLDLHLPVLDGYNTTQFPCAHCFHTHCIIRAIIGGLQRCPLCRNEPDDRGACTVCLIIIYVNVYFQLIVS